MTATSLMLVALAAQTQFVETLGDAGLESATSLVRTSDGGYALAGRGVLLAKFDSLGVLQWAQRIQSWAYANSLVQTSDGGYAIAGYAWDSLFYMCALVAKFNSTGAFQWARGIASDEEIAYSIRETTDGANGLIVSGFDATNNFFFVSRFSGSGSHVWTWLLTEPIGGNSTAAITTPDLGWAVAVSVWGIGAGGYDVLLVKFDLLGNIEWARALGGVWNDYVCSLVQTYDGGYVVAGYTQSFGAGWDDFLVAKFDGMGNLVWNRTIGGSSRDSALSIVETADSGYAVAGYTWSFGAGGADMLLVKLDSAGTFLWARAVGGAGNDRAYEVVQAIDGGYALAGETNTYGGGDYDHMLVKGDSSGNFCLGTVVSPTVTDPPFIVTNLTINFYNVTLYYLIETLTPSLGANWTEVCNVAVAEHPAEPSASPPLLSRRGEGLRLTLSTGADVSLAIYDAGGRRAALLERGHLNAGDYSYALPRLPRGLYLAHLAANSARRTLPLLVR